MAEKEREKRDFSGFVSGVLALSLSAVIVKIIGLVYKIPMLRLLGSEGMGYFNSAYEIYTLFCTVATTGLPVAMSVMISSGKGGRDGRTVFSVALKLFALLGIAGSAIMIAFAQPFAAFLGGEGAVLCIFAIAPTVFFICLTSAYRGYFQGFGKMTPTAISQMLEALGKLLLGLMFAYIALSFGADTEVVAAFAVLGLTLGMAVSMLYMIFKKRAFSIDKQPTCEELRQDNKDIAKELLKTAIPVTLSSAVISLTKVIDMAMILRRLQVMGISAENAFASYGNYTTLALPLFGLAPALISSVALPLIPQLSSAVANGDRERQRETVKNALGISSFISMPISAGLVLFSKPILELLFSGESEAIEMSHPLLACLGLSVTLSCFITVGNAILQAYGSPAIPILSMTLGSIIKIILAYIMIGNPKLGLIGAPISTFFCDLVINSVNFAYIGKHLGDSIKISETVLKPFAFALASVLTARVIYNIMIYRCIAETLAIAIAILTSGALYMLLFLPYILSHKKECYLKGK